jgi:Flp pilus assembly protein TadD
MVWLAFGQTLHHAFVNYDDNTYVYQNLSVLQGLTRRGILWALTFGEIGHWHPVTWFSHMLDCQVWGLRAGGHHLTNLLLHATATVFLFVALRQMMGALWRSAFVAALFAIHPQRVESVAWIAERKDVLSGVFFMLTILAYVCYARKPSSRGSYALVVVLFALGLMSKGMLVTLPFVLLLLDYWPLRRLAPEMLESIRQPKNRARAWRLVAEKVPLFVLSAASCVMTSLSPERIPPALQMSLGSRIENAIVSYFIYVKQMLCPLGLQLPYFNPPGGFPLWEVGLALALLIGVSIGVFVFWKTRPYLLVGWLWYFGMMAPVIGLVQISYYTRADRYTYLPQIGLYVMAVWGGADLLGRSRAGRYAFSGAALLLLAALLRCTHAQASYWHDSETLWMHALKENPRNHVALNNLGLVLVGNGQIESAITHFERALEIQPLYADAYNNVGTALFHTGRRREAVVQYEKAVELAPDQPRFQNNLGTALAQSGRLTEALLHFRKAVELKPDFENAHADLGYALLLQGETDEALSQFQKALELRPDSVETHKQIAQAFLKKGRTADAIAHYRKALEIQPNDAEARRRLADTLAEQNQ